MRSKNSQLELVNAQQYKEGLKRENEIERLYGQVLELGKSVDMKDGKIN